MQLHSRRSPGLENYGWRVYEGRTRFTNEQPTAGRLVFPIAVQPNGPNCSVIGGFVYRGTTVTAARGRYFFGDNCEAQIRTLTAPAGKVVRGEDFSISSLSSFGEDAKASSTRPRSTASSIGSCPSGGASPARRPRGALVAALSAGIALAAGDREGRAGYRFEVVMRGLKDPVHAAVPASEPNNMYVVEKGGRIRVTCS